MRIAWLPGRSIRPVSGSERQEGQLPAIRPPCSVCKLFGLWPCELYTSGKESPQSRHKQLIHRNRLEVIEQKCSSQRWPRCEHSKSIRSECRHDGISIPEQETHQKTIYEIFDIIAAQNPFLVAVTGHPGLQPFLGSSHGNFLCDIYSGMSRGQRIHKYLALLQQLRRDFQAPVVQMHPHFAITDGAPHKVFRTGHDSNPTADRGLQSKRELLLVGKSKRCGLKEERLDIVHEDDASYALFRMYVFKGLSKRDMLTPYH
jgi:hypothetical protein